MQAADQKVKSWVFNVLRGNEEVHDAASTGKKSYRCGRFLLGVKDAAGGSRLWREARARRYGELARLEIDATLITLC